MKNYIIVALITVFIAVGGTADAQSLDYKTLQKTIQAGIKKAYPASVRCWGYDTVRKMQNSAQFSGVVVNKDGTILTVSHAIQPNRTYKVLFPDGKEVMAIALGKVGLAAMQTRPDIGMMKIITPGNWPYAEMGWSSSLKINEACFGISYPETLNQLLPTVRFGRIANVLNQWGFIQSTSKMEPGDSGGPLFDYMGSVIAMHSRCELAEDENYEVPIAVYRKYWLALKVPEDYKALPTQEDEVKVDPFAQNILSIPQLQNLNNAFTTTATPFTLKSKLNGLEQTVLGTAFVSADKTIMVSKASLVGSEPMIEIQGKQVKLTVLGTDKANDLVLLSVPVILKGAIKLYSLNIAPEIEMNALGKFLISPLKEGQRIGVLGSTYFTLPIKFSAGYFGAPANFRDGKILITRVIPHSPAATAKLMPGDQLTGINNVQVTKAEHYGAEMIKYSPGDTITIQIKRAGKPLELTAVLTKRPNGTHPADNFDGGKSTRLDGFEKVFAHDGVIKPNECGGAVYDAQGNFYGINIARFSRTATLVMPVDMVKAFIDKNI